MSKKLIGVLLLLGAVVSAFAWYRLPSKATGCYWMYDDAEPGPDTFPPLPTFQNLSSNPEATKLAPYNHQAYMLSLPDSFYYFGKWFRPGTKLYISPDGWVSFDEDEAIEDGFPNPPFITPPFPNNQAPNSIIAPLWQDNNCTNTPGPYETKNRVYYYHDTTFRKNRLIVHWHDVQSHITGNEYDYELTLELGGLHLLEDNLSHHFIHFFYNDCNEGWDGDDGVAGFEGLNGKKGIYYQGNIHNGRVVRAGCLLRCECDCGDWDPVAVEWRYTNTNVECGSPQPLEPIPQVVVDYGQYHCAVPESPTCQLIYRWTVTGPVSAPGFPISGGPAGAGSFSFIPTKRGIYTITITPYCNEMLCEACTFQISTNRRWRYRP
jgi:hypothetical protein